MRIAICDDDKNELEYVYTVICENFKQKNILCESKKYISAISLLEDNEKEPFDAIFLDLDMQEISGMDVASQINKSNEFTEIIFVTNHDELVYKAYRFKALGFVRKKYLQDEIDEIVDLLIKSVNEKQRYIVLSDCDTEKKYHIEDIFVGMYLDVPDKDGIYHKHLICLKDVEQNFQKYFILPCDYKLQFIRKDGSKRIKQEMWCVLRSQSSYNSGLWTDYVFTATENQEILFLPTNHTKKE